MTGGYTGRLGFVDLTKGEVKIEKLDNELARHFVGGPGLGARILFECQMAGANPLGPDNIIGFVTGPATGTPVPTGARYTVVCKSPLTGGWGDANSGGYFGRELKVAGWDAIFVSGIASSPRYLFVTNDGIEIKDASHIWGKDTYETEDILIEEIGDSKVRVACIGPAGENQALISGIVHDKGRIAARSGVGAVMGSKLLKAVAVRGKGEVPVAHIEHLKQLRKDFIRQMSDVTFIKILREWGTCGLTGDSVRSGASPIKNWLLAGIEAFPSVDKIGNGDNIIKYQLKRYACWNCPIACGGTVAISEGKYLLSEMHKPEYETVAAFGNMCLNDDLASIFKLNDMCNRSGLDTISTGSTIAFAMECYDKGIINKVDTDGIELTWGNSESIIAITEKMIHREGFGNVLADGVKVASGRIGKGAESYAMHIGGQEPGLQNPLFLPGRGTGFVVNPTPGRHTAASPLTCIDINAAMAPYPELQFSGFEPYEYKNKGEASAVASSYWQVGASAGVCLFSAVTSGIFPLLDFLSAVTGWDISMKEALQTGARILTLQQLFNIREGVEPSEVKMPDRMVGVPPMSTGPLKGITLDIGTLVKEYREAMGWDSDTGHPTQARLTELKLVELWKNHK